LEKRREEIDKRRKKKKEKKKGKRESLMSKKSKSSSSKVIVKEKEIPPSETEWVPLLNFLPIASYCVCSIVMTLTNKFLLTEYKLSMGFFLLTVQVRFQISNFNFFHN